LRCHTSPVTASRACPVTDLACTSNPTNVRSFPTEASRNLWLYRTSLSLPGNPRPIASEASGLLIPSNILNKLDLPSRTAAAAYAARLGLLGDADV